MSEEDRVREIRRKIRKKYSSEENVRMVLEGLRGEESIAALCRRKRIPSNLYYRWSKEFLETGKKRLARDTKREATSSEVTESRQENEQLKQAVAQWWPVPNGSATLSIGGDLSHEFQQAEIRLSRSLSE